jgi:2-methylisocitrate lyase-like PEP mutase family enzyme
MGSTVNRAERHASAATILRKRLEAGEFIFAPGVHDGLSARIALGVGFDALYMVWAFP